MAGLGPKVTLTFAGDDSRLSRTIKSVEAKTSSLGARFSGLAKGVGGLASAGGALNVVGGAVGAVSQLAGAALLVPAAALAAAAATNTWKLATAGFGEAMSAGLAGDTAAFTEATKDMAPEMQAAAKSVATFRPEVDALKKAVQGNFWSEFSGEITRVGKTYLPIMHDGLGTISQDLGGMAFSALQATRTPLFTGAVTSILDGTSGALGNMRDAGADVLSGFAVLGGAGAQYLSGLGTGVGSLAERFAGWAARAVESGRFFDWVDGAIAGIRQLGEIGGNVGSVIGSVFRGLGGDTTSFLGPVSEVTARMAELAASTQGQAAIQALGEAMRAAGTLTSSVFLSALQVLLPVIIALSPLVTTVATTLAGWAPVLGPLVVAGYAFAQMLTLVRGGLTLYNTAMTLAKSQTVIAAATKIGAWTMMAAQAMARAVVMAAAWVVAMGPVGWVIAAVVGLVALVVANWDRVKGATVAAWNAVSSAVSSAWAAVKGAVSSAASAVVGALSSAWNTVRSTAVAAWNGLVGAIRSGISTALGVVRALPGQILGVLGNLGSLLVNAGRSLIEGLWRGIQGAIGWVKGMIGGALSSIRNLFPFSPAREGPFSGTGYTTYSGQALMQDFGEGIRSSQAGVRSAASSVLGGAQASLAGGGAAGAAGGGRLQLVVAPGGDSALATLIMRMVRTGQIQIKAV